MNLNQIDIQLASRDGIQAINLGFVTARRYQWTLLMASFIAMLPVFLIAVLLTLWLDAFIGASLLIWWCKPYYDRVILYQASRLLFRESVRFTDVIRSLLPVCRHGLWMNLTLGRLSIMRSLTLPVYLLEQLTGRDYRHRVKSLSREAKSSASSATIGLFHLDAVLYINCFLFVLMLLPDIYREAVTHWFVDITQNNGDIRWLFVAMLAFQAMCTGIIEMFYVMIGFMLYLNSRIKVEGWHIELAFKRLATRLSAAKHALLGIFSLAMLLSILVLSTLPTPTLAKTESSPVIIDTEADKAILKTILSDDSINPYVQETRWKSVNTDISSPENREFNPPDFNALATLIKFSLIAVGIAVIVFGVYRYREVFAFFNNQPQTPRDDNPTVMFGLEVTKDSLPNELTTTARRLLTAGDILGALSLLYRGSLASIISDKGVKIKESDTEGDCLRVAKPRLDAKSFRYFSQLTALWQRTVYAHLIPEQHQIEQLIDHWDEFFAIIPTGAADES